MNCSKCGSVSMDACTLPDCPKDVVVWHAPERKPKKSGVYRCRQTIMHHEDVGTPMSQTAGYAFWDRLRQRWGAMAFTKSEALKRKYTAGWAYNTDQRKEWVE